MSNEPGLIHESNIVSVKLMAGEEAEAVAAVMAKTSADAEITRHPSYLAIAAPHRLVFDLPAISEELGRPYDTPTFLVIMSSYTGRINVEDERITLSAALM